MNKILKKFEKYLKKLQESDEQTKKTATIVGTIFIMVVIFLIWLQFFNPISQPAAATPPEQNQFSFFDTFKNGLNIIGGAIGGEIKNLSQTLGSPRQYIINPPQK
jgi:hypothetical protein